MSAPVEPRQFRSALAAFTTGVTIVTTRDAQGADVGLTANSFNSVSLEPPMVLWSLAKSSRSLRAFVEAEHFAVHILAADQAALSERFAKRGLDKFAGLSVSRGHGQVPLLEGCAARFECRTAFRYAGGDHEIFVGEVITFENFERAPLVFHGGRYARALMASGDGTAREVADRPQGLTALIAAAHAGLEAQLRAEPNALAAIEAGACSGMSLDEVATLERLLGRVIHNTA